ncbi:endonuclease/exonuclease/phosphatase family protein [Neptunicella marina]|uniref:Endonuclease/exonuclease/phosphatase family protein n=2 Tax=Neptunicella marina TaxID=2125989 RepID=A0A8J6M1E8_9ALTE|nr:endonuclease/exonuclease/phosphatase family protein [Neptunicella marina]
MSKVYAVFCWSIVFMSQIVAASETLKVATFNVSMEATNYVARESDIKGNELFERLATSENPHIKNIAAIIQRINPDIILLNEFDYTPDENKGVKAFVKHYLNKDQPGSKGIDYPYYYIAPVNTGVDSGVDLNRDGVASGKGDDAFGYGVYPGQYGMVLLSKFPIDKSKIRTFQLFKWRDMPNNMLTTIQDKQGKSWYSADAQDVLRLSSKSHWDVPVNVNGKTVHILASHPTPPVFDGPEDRNGKRNHDEVRFWVDYLNAGQNAAYIYDDQGQHGGFSGKRFVVLGDLNSSQDEGDSYKDAIGGLINHTTIISEPAPMSEGGKRHSPDNPFAATHTAGWRMRADYVLPSEYGFSIKQSGIFWPTEQQADYVLIKNRESSSDHRLVWAELVLTDND